MFPIVLDDNYRAPEKRWFAKGRANAFVTKTPGTRLPTAQLARTSLL
jgi:hypothetical protein